MSITEFHGEPFNRCREISLKTTNVSPTVALEKMSGVHQQSLGFILWTQLKSVQHFMAIDPAVVGIFQSELKRSILPSIESLCLQKQMHHTKTYNTEKYPLCNRFFSNRLFYS